MPPFVELMTTILWKMKKNPEIFHEVVDKKEVEVVDEEYQYIDNEKSNDELKNYELINQEEQEDPMLMRSNKFQPWNVKYFEKQRIKSISAKESVKEEKLSFKGRLGWSSKWDESNISMSIEASNRNKDDNGWNNLITDNKSFSFKNLSQRNRDKNNEKDTINEVLNSQNSSMKNFIKENEKFPNEPNYSQLGFSNLNVDIEYKGNEQKRDQDQKSLASFGRKARQKHPKSPFKNPYFPDHNSKIYKPVFEETQNHSMIGLIDANSNNIEQRFMFGNESRMSRMDEGHSMSMMFKNQHSNQFQGTPNKIYPSQQNLFDNGEHSNISMGFPNLEHDDYIPKKLFHKDLLNENSQFGLNLLNGQHESIQEIESGKENGDIEIPSQNLEKFPQIFFQPENNPNNENIPESEQKSTKDFIQNLAESQKEEWSLPHPNVLFGLKNGKNSLNFKHKEENDVKFINKNMNKRNKKRMKKRKKVRMENRWGIGSMFLFNDINIGHHPNHQLGSLINQNNTPAINPYFHVLASVSRKLREKNLS